MEIQDFESHTHTTIEPAPGLTAITGTNDVGKSGILRALRWVYCNVPSGGGFIRAGAARACVSVTLEDGTQVTRERSVSGAINRYILAEPGKEPQVLEGFGRDVPEVIAEALGIRSIELGGEEVVLTYQNQHDAIFLLRPGLSGAVRAQAIGRLTGVHYLHEASTEVASDIAAAKRALREAKQEQMRLTQQLEKYADLDALRSLVAQLEALRDRVNTLEEQIKQLRDLKARWNAHLEAAARVRATLAKFSILPESASLLERAQRLNDQYTTLCVLKQRWDTVEGSLHSLAATLAATARVSEAERWRARAARLNDHTAALCALKERWGATEGSLRSLVVILAATAKMGEAEEWRARAAQAHQQCEFLMSAAQRWAEITAALESARTIIQRGVEGIKRAETALARVKEIANNLDQLRRVADDWTRYLIQLTTVENTLVGLRDVDAAAAELARVRRANEKLAQLEDLRSRMRDWKVRAQVVRTQYEEACRAEQKAKEDYRVAVLSTGKCPTCGQPVDQAKLEEHLASLG